ncbi:MAG: hypothetical protein QOC85_96 [Streptomyces sp.]|nr:hypothetical protein [Streptomyces sp.]
MGERQSDGGTPAHRAAPRAASRPAPTGTGPGFPETGPSLGLGPALDALVAAVRGGPVDPAAEGRAVAAFRAAREQGAHAGRSRRRDDWRPREQRRASRSLRAALAALIAGLALGGAAFAGIGPAGLSFDDDGHRGGGPSSGTTRPAERPGPSAGPTGTTPLGRPPAPQDTGEKKPKEPKEPKESGKEQKPSKEKKPKKPKKEKKDKKAGTAGETEATESATPATPAETTEPKKPKSGAVATQ